MGRPTVRSLWSGGSSVGGAINGNVRGPWGNGEGWNDATENVLPDWFQVEFAGSKTIDEIDVFSLHDNYTEQNTPTETQTFSLYGLVNFQVQYWTGSAWATIPGGNVTGNNKVWRKFAFAPVTTSKIRLWITGVPDAWSRLVELQAWAAEPGVTNLALNKPTSQSSTDWGGLAPRGVDGNTDGNYANGSVTHTAFETQPWWQVDLQSVQNIQNINVWNRTDCCAEALTNFYVFVSDNAFTANDVTSTQNQPGVSTYYVAGQGGVPTTLGVNRTGRYVRVQLGAYERLSVAEVQVFGGGAIKQARWLVSDQLGTPRLILEQGGTLATVKRHDYAPFGEDLVAVGGRNSLPAYSSGDGLRQQFTLKERDIETGLDYFLARYYSSTQGRFTSPDEFRGGPDELYTFVDDASDNPTFYADTRNPQSLNKYQYSFNNPLRYVDPDGHDPEEAEPQDPKPVIPVPVPGRFPPVTVPIGGTTGKIPTDQTLKDDLIKIWELPDPYLYPISQTIGTAPDPTMEPVPVPPLAVPAPKPQAQPMPPPPAMARRGPHKKKKQSTGKNPDHKEANERPGAPNKQPPGFKPRIPRRPQDMPPKPPKPVIVPPEKKPERKPEIGAERNPHLPEIHCVSRLLSKNNSS